MPVTSLNDIVVFNDKTLESNFKWTIHSQAQDKRIVREHYDRGDDFFEAFLGERMVYTSGIFLDESESLEQSQDNKIDLVCRKLMTRPGDELLDIG